MIVFCVQITQSESNTQKLVPSNDGEGRIESGLGWS